MMRIKGLLEESEDRHLLRIAYIRILANMAEHGVLNSLDGTLAELEAIYHFTKQQAKQAEQIDEFIEYELQHFYCWFAFNTISTMYKAGDCLYLESWCNPDKDAILDVVGFGWMPIP